jgi:hypothetical protein
MPENPPPETGTLHQTGPNRWILNHGSNHEVTVADLTEAQATALRTLLVEHYAQGRQVEEDAWRPLTEPLRFVELEEWFQKHLPIYRERLHDRLEARPNTAFSESERLDIGLEIVKSFSTWPNDPFGLETQLRNGEMSDRFVWRALRSTFHQSAARLRRYQRRTGPATQDGFVEAWRLEADDPSCPTCTDAAGVYPLDDPPRLPLHIGGCNTYVTAIYDI